MRPSDVNVQIGDQQSVRCERVSVTRSVLGGAGSVVCEVSVQGQPEARVGQDVNVFVGPQLERLLSGTVDQVEVTDDQNGLALTVSGRDRTSVLIDGSVHHGTPAEWNDIKLFDLVEALCGQKQIVAVLDQGTAGSAQIDEGDPFDRFAIEPHESNWSAIERACRARAVLVGSDNLGQLRLFRLPLHRATVPIERGRNCTSMTASVSMLDRFASYTVLGQHTPSDLDFGLPTIDLFGKASDRGVPALRTLTVVADGQVDQTTAQQRAAFEAAFRAARSSTLSATVPSWEQTAGKFDLWREGQQVQVINPQLGIAELRIIDQLTYQLDRTGFTCQMSLVFAAAYQAQPEIRDDTTDADLLRLQFEGEE